MAIRYEVKAEIGKLTKWASQVAKDQIPYVTARTLTDLASEVRSAHIAELRRNFILRNKYVIRSFRVNYAKKSDWPNCTSCEGSVQEFIALQSLGGTKVDRGGVFLGVPMAQGQMLRGRPNKHDTIKRPMWVRALLEKKGFIQVKGNGSGSELLLKQVRSGKRRNRFGTGRMNFGHKKHQRKHKGKRGWKRETIYVLKRGVKIQARFPFYILAAQTVERLYSMIFLRNLRNALE